MPEITVTQAEWAKRNSFDSTIFTDAWKVTGLAWEGYSSFIDDTLMMVFFIKNELIPKAGIDGVVAIWEGDGSMVVGVQVVVV